MPKDNGNVFGDLAPGVRRQLLHMVFAEQVDRQRGARPHGRFIPRLAHGAQLHLGGLPPRAPGGARDPQAERIDRLRHPPGIVCFLHDYNS